MQTSSVSTAYGGGQAQRLLAALLQQQTKTGQDVQGAIDASAGDRPSGPHPGRPGGPRPGGGASGQFAASTLTDLISTQEGEQASPFDALAGDLIKQADTDGDGSLSADEIKAAIGGDSTSDQADGLSAAMAKLDTDGNGTLSASELSAGLETKRSGHGRGPGHAPPSSSDVAAKLVSQADSNGDGALGLDEIGAALGSDPAGSAGTLTASISKLDTDGDGKLSAAELSAALDAFRTASQRGAAAGSAAASSAQAVA